MTKALRALAWSLPVATAFVGAFLVGRDVDAITLTHGCVEAGCLGIEAGPFLGVVSWLFLGCLATLVLVALLRRRAAAAVLATVAVLGSGASGWKAWSSFDARRARFLTPAESQAEGREQLQQALELLAAASRRHSPDRPVWAETIERLPRSEPFGCRVDATLADSGAVYYAWNGRTWIPHPPPAPPATPRPVAKPAALPGSVRDETLASVESLRSRGWKVSSRNERSTQSVTAERAAPPMSGTGYPLPGTYRIDLEVSAVTIPYAEDPGEVYLTAHVQAFSACLRRQGR